MKRLTIVALLLGSYALCAQSSTLKYGKVTEEELNLEECSFYPEANAMILGETGSLIFKYSEGWQYEAIITRRIKVFNKLDKDIANVSIVVYDPVDGSNKEEVVSIKATTYNLENGEIIKTKLTNSEEYKTRINDYRQEVSFAMPDIRDGSVFEYEYKIKSDFISNLMPWHFQHDLPTAASEFQYTLPEFFNYSVNQLGTYFPLERTQESKAETFTYKYEIQEAFGQVKKGTGEVPSNSSRITWSGSNLLPLIEEPFMNNRPNIPCRLEFQLMSIQMPHSPLKLIATNYQQFNQNIMDLPAFGGTLKKGNFAKDQIPMLPADTHEKAVAIYNWLRNHFSYNDVYAYTSSKAGRAAFNETRGNVADINLTLVAAYREAGLEANPVILSTRGHGIVHPVSPSYEDFNYVIAAVTTPEGLFLTDATTSLPFGMLPVRCLNGNGWMASEQGGSWVNLKEGAAHTATTLLTTTIDPKGLNTKYEVQFKGYAAYEANSYLLNNNTKVFTEKVASSLADHELGELAVRDSLNSSVDFRYTFTSTKPVDDPEILYIKPIACGGITENPFTREERFSPVDLEYKIKKLVVSKIEIPDGYVASLPAAVSYSLPDQAGRFTYTCSQFGNMVNIISSFEIAGMSFLSTDYPLLKQFYQLVAEKNSELIVLKAQ